ncbi:MAG: hypothetical protein ACI9N1_001544 [Flavobacteriales bacterium]|jgi:hypothetical protein
MKILFHLIIICFSLTFYSQNEDTCVVRLCDSQLKLIPTQKSFSDVGLYGYECIASNMEESFIVVTSEENESEIITVVKLNDIHYDYIRFEENYLFIWSEKYYYILNLSCADLITNFEDLLKIKPKKKQFNGGKDLLTTKDYDNIYNINEFYKIKNGCIVKR